MGERGGAMAVVSLQKQPGTVGRDGSRGPSGGLATGSLPTAHSGCEPLLAIETSDFDRCLQLVGPATLAPRRACTAPGRMDTSTQRRDFAAIRCSCCETRPPMQFAIAQPDSCGSSRTAVRLAGSGRTAERSGWARIPNRLDRRSASFETAACAASSG